MADFKCKYCGHSLHPVEGQTLITCDRCDETIRIVTTDNAKKNRLLDEAMQLRLSCLFDRAKRCYETIIQDFPKEAEAYWGWVLCEYGVEFQQDSRSGKYLPTLHRISQTSIQKDPYYLKAIEYANPLDVMDYERIAAELERIRRRFMELSQKKENIYDIFISFKQTDDYHRETVDCAKAENLYYKLKDMGYRVFFSKVTLANRGGDDYEPIIYTALESSQIMLVVGSSRENLEAPWVRNEWNRFLNMMQKDNRKKLLPVFFGDMTPEQMPDDLQSIQGYDIDTQRGVDRVLSRVAQLFPKKEKTQAVVSQKGNDFVVSEDSLLTRAKMETQAKNWNKAIEYYNRILDINPKSCGAWLGLMLSEMKMNNLEEYKEFLLYGWTRLKPEKKTVSMTGDEEYDLIYKCLIPNYLTENEMLDMLPKALPYESALVSMKKNVDKAEEFFSKNNYYIYAVQYADPEKKKVLEALKTDIMKQIADKIVELRDQEKETVAALEKKHTAQLKEARDRISKKYQEVLQQRENDYAKGMQVNSGKDVPEAIRCLKKVGKYKNAPQKLDVLMHLQSISAQIDDGSRYLLEYTAQHNSQLLEALKSAKQKMRRIMPTGIAGYAGVIFYIFNLVIVISAGWPSAVCAILGIIIGGVLWINNQPYPAFAVTVILDLAAGALVNIQWPIIFGILFGVSFLRKGGFAKSLLEKKSGQIALNKATEAINAYEWELRNVLNDIWVKALGVPYDGVALRSIEESMKRSDLFIRQNQTPDQGSNSGSAQARMQNRQNVRQNQGQMQNQQVPRTNQMQNRQDGRQNQQQMQNRQNWRQG